MPTLSLMSYTAISNVRFAEELARPPSDRPRADGIVYPRVAQIKGESDRQSSYDLFWNLETLSAASESKLVKSPRVSNTATPGLVSSPRSPRLGLFHRAGETTTPKLPSTPLSNLLHEETYMVLSTPPLLCLAKFPDLNDSSSTDGASAYSSASSSSGSDL